MNLEKSEVTNKKLNMWQIILIVIGSPIWVSLLIAVFSIFFSIYITLWSVIISFWSAFGSMCGITLYMILTGIVITFENNSLIGLAMISMGIICMGLSILLFLGCKLATNGIILLTKKIVVWTKNCFLKKEVAHE